MFVGDERGPVKGMLCIGQNPATSLNAKLERAALRKLDWLVVKDNWLHETATFWKNAPEVQDGEVATADIETEVFFFPSAQVAEIEGTLHQHPAHAAVALQGRRAAGRLPLRPWFTYQLGKRLKKLYAGSRRCRATRASSNLTWDYEHEDAARARSAASRRALKILKEINGYYTADPARHVAGFADLKDDGSTTCASWIYSRRLSRRPDRNLAGAARARPARASPARSWTGASPGRRTAACSTTAPRPIPHGKPWSERKKWVWWDEAQSSWTGYDVPDFPPTKPPDRAGQARRDRPGRALRHRRRSS